MARDPKPPPQPSAVDPYPSELRVNGALLSFVVPGLGQIYQGVKRGDRNRLTKGIMFLAVLWGMFFYGMWLGKGKNVYVVDIADRRPIVWFGKPLPNFPANLINNFPYIGQFWIGAAAWPALIHYNVPESYLSDWLGDFQRMPPHPKDEVDARKSLRDRQDEAERDLNRLQLEPDMGRLWDVAWVYTVIAGLLNILVIYDAWSGPAQPTSEEDKSAPKPEEANA